MGERDERDDDAKLVAWLEQRVHSLERAQRISGVGSFEWDLDRGSMWLTDQTLQVLGIEPRGDEAGDELFWAAIHPDDRDQVREQIAQALDAAGRFSVEHRLLLPDGGERFVHQQGELGEPPESTGRRIHGTVIDVTDRRQAEEAILRLANYDSLTGLANRHYFHRQLDEAVERADSLEEPLALIYMDLDGFKRINDTLGHGAGDELLRHVAELLRTHVRQGDLVGRVDKVDRTLSVSRLGGDEFTILLANIDSSEEAGDVARSILRALPQPMTIEGHEVSVTGSIGIAVFPDDGDDRESLVKHADTAMYHAKEQGRNNFQFFSRAMNASATRKLKLEGRLRGALANDEVELHYQPKWDLASLRVVGLEALLRWHTDDLGPISPKELVPLAEETGLIRELGAWVLDRSCRQIREWKDQGLEVVPVAVNVSTRQFLNQELTHTLTEALRRTNLHPADLEIEITESALLQDDENTAVILRDLRAIGVRIALDDFGTGYSSLSYLTRFPLDVLKLDRSFVRDIESDPAARSIAAAVVGVAQSLDLDVIAEGVDTEAQIELLRELGCNQLQGFVLAPALPSEECEALLRSTRME